MKTRLYRNDKILLAAELFFLIICTISMCGSRKIYEFNSTNLEIYNDSVVYEPGDGSYAIQGGGEPHESAMLGIAKMEVARGVYEVLVRYTSNTGINGQPGSCDNKAGTLQIRSYRNPTEVGYNTIGLADGDSVKTDRLSITSLGSIRDIDVKVFFNGYGFLKIEEIVFRELLVWRVACVLKWVLVFAAVNFCYFYFVRKNQYKDKHILAGLVFMTLFSSLLALQDYVMGGHDLAFHLMRIQSLGKAIAAGKWIAPVQMDMANGYGYAAPLFYGQVFLYIPAVLYNMAVPLHICYQIYVVCVNIATCIVSYFCFKAIVKNKETALIGAYCYQMSAYRITDVYIRAALGEYTAMIFLPLVLYGFYRVYTLEAGKLTIRDTLCIVFGLGGIIQSHLITVELTALFIIILCVILFRKTIEPRRFLVLAEAAVLVVLCNLGFLVPLLESMKMDIAVNEKTMGNMQELGALMYQVFGMFMHPDQTFTLGLGLVLGTALFCWCYVKRFDWGIAENPFLKAGAAAFILLVFSVMASFSAFPWDSLATAEGMAGVLGGIMAVIQFPWRFHVISTILCVFLTILGITILCGSGRGKYGYAAGGIIVFLLTMNVGLFYTEYPDIAMVTKVYAATDNSLSVQVVSGGEYRLEGTDFDLCRTKEIITEDGTIGVAGYRSGYDGTMFACVNNGRGTKYVDIPLFCYDNYRAYDRESGKAVPLGRGTNNRIRLLVEGGYQGDICVVYQIPVLWKLAYLVSALTVLGIIGYISIPRWFGKDKASN